VALRSRSERERLVTLRAIAVEVELLARRGTEEKASRSTLSHSPMLLQRVIPAVCITTPLPPTLSLTARVFANIR